MSERSLRKPKSMLTKELGVGARVDGLKRERRPTLTRGRLHARHDIGDRFGCHRLILVAIVGGVPQRLTCHSAAAAAFVAPPLVSSTGMEHYLGRAKARLLGCMAQPVVQPGVPVSVALGCLYRNLLESTETF